MFNLPSLYRITFNSDGREVYREEYATSAMDAIQIAMINHNSAGVKNPKSVRVTNISLAPSEIEAITERLRQRTDDVLASLFQPKL